jgi:hypothetical protein
MKATPAKFPLRPRKAAELLLRKRLRDVGLSTYFRALRWVYRVACFDDDEYGPLIPDLRVRYPVTSRRAKSPRIDVALIEAVIALELGLAAHVGVNPSHVDRWLKLRARRVREGHLQEPLSAREREILFPEWALEAVGVFLEIGPSASRARVENFGSYYAGGEDDFTSTKSSAEQSRDVPAPSSTRSIRENIVGLFDVGTTLLKKDFEAEIPAILAPWPGDWRHLAIHPNRRSRPRRRARVRAEVVRPAFQAVDQTCAAPFVARFGLTDLDVAANEAVFWDSFESPDHARRWLTNANIALLVRNRALTLATLIVGERTPQIAEAVIGDITWAPYDHPGVEERWGVLRPVGALLVTRSEKSDSDRGAHEQPLPIEVCDRLRVLLFIYKVLRGSALPGHAPLFLKDLYSEGPPAGLGRRAIATAAASILSRGGAYPEWADPRSYNPLRRYTDTVIGDLFEEFRSEHEGIPGRVDAATVKEITIGHENVRLDPHTYSGLTDDEGRFVVASYGAEIVVQTIYGELGVRLGPDVGRIRSELTIQRGIEQTLARVEDDYASAKARLSEFRRSAAVADAWAGVGLLEFTVQRDMLADERDDLKDQADVLDKAARARRDFVADLFNEQDLWVPLAEDARRLSRRDLRRLRDETLQAGTDAYPPMRDFYTLLELARCLRVDPTTIADWLRHARPETVSRLCPWIGQAPATKPNQRTVLIAASAIDFDRIRDGDTKVALRECLARWPAERGWEPDRGKKTHTVRALAGSPICLQRAPSNDLLAEAPETCIRVFVFEGT